MERGLDHVEDAIELKKEQVWNESACENTHATVLTLDHLGALMEIFM